MTRIVVAVVCLSFFQSVSASPDIIRGQLLYENHCSGCHESTVHVRDTRHADSAGVLKEYISKWSASLQLGWTSTDLDDVTLYLNERFYHLDK